MNLGQIPWKNAATRQAFVFFVLDLNDPAALAKEWDEICSGDAVALLAKEIKKDLRAECQAPDPFFAELFRTALRTIDWEQIAKVFLRSYLPASSRTEAEGEQGGSSYVD